MESSSPRRSPSPDPDSDDVEERMRAAIQAIRCSGVQPNKRYVLSLRQAAKDFNVPRTTLTDRWNGIKPRQDAHVHEQVLSPEKEQVLVVWAKVLARRGIPLSPATLIDYASELAGKPVGQTWPRGFRQRHPDLKLRMTTGLEQCRARALNEHTVRQYFDILNELITKYNIPPENIYNMDEKGILLGVGKRTAAFVDRDQKMLYQVEDGNRELVTVIECISADGEALRPCVIYKGARRDLAWGRNNPCGASVSHSHKGWTDQELGSEWLEKDFEPQSAARNRTGGYRLLILDGHNSHCTLRFCQFAEAHGILVVCLPPHTTHALQPNDVGVFGPLASSWKKEVLKASRRYIPITKHNFLSIYHIARERALKKATIISAFANTGIHPLNPDAIDPTVFEPSKNTTTQAAQPMAAELPTLLEPIPEDAPHHTSSPSSLPTTSDISSSSVSAPSGTTRSPSTSTTTSEATTSKSSTSSESSRYRIAGLPPPLPHTASRKSLYHENLRLRSIIEEARAQLERDHAQMILMDSENARLRARAFAKAKDKPVRESGHARHMTAEENLDALARSEWESAMQEVLKEAGPKFRLIRTKITGYYKRLAEAEAAVARATKSAEKAREKARKAEEKKAAKKAKEDKKEAEKKRKEAEKAAERERRVAEKVAKEAERIEKAEKVAATRAVKVAKKAAGRTAKAAREAMTKGAGDIPYGGGTSESERETGLVERWRIAAPNFDVEWSDSGSAVGGVSDEVIPVMVRPRPRPVLRKVRAERTEEAESSRVAEETSVGVRGTIQNTPRARRRAKRAAALRPSTPPGALQTVEEVVAVLSTPLHRYPTRTRRSRQN